MKCKKCGSENLNEFNGFYSCKECGTKICRCGNILHKRRTNGKYDCDNENCTVSRVVFPQHNKGDIVVIESSYVISSA